MPSSAVYVCDVAQEVLGRDPEALRASLLALQAASAERNRQCGVRGLLACGSGFLVEWLEGEQAGIRQALDAIRADPLRRNVQLLWAGATPALLGAGSTTVLSRAEAEADTGSQALVQRLRAGPLPAEGPAGVPAAILRLLAEPAAGSTAQTIGLFGQTGVWPAGLLSHLEARWRTAAHRTRLLGPQGLEREAFIEHLDHVDPEFGPLTLIHHSPGLQAAAWMQGSIRPLTVATLFFSGTTEQAVLDFAGSVLRQLGEATHREVPLLGLLGRAAAPFAPALQALFDGAGRAASLVPVPLADSAAVWSEIGHRLERRSTSQPPPAAAPAVVAAAGRTAPGAGQVGGDVTSAAGATAATRPTGTAPAPATARTAMALPATAPTAPDPAPQQHPARQSVAWVQHLLTLEGVAAAGLWCLERHAPLAFHPRASGNARALAGEFETWCAAPVPEGAADLLVRWQNRLSLLHRHEGAAALVFLATQEGYCNEPWLRLQLRACLDELEAAGWS
ncbi:MAG TPA: BLUF domain-containing protein [Ramlibacter sp.]|jgi:hypothetical protein|uniref:BLUF domain-containing protein n=1 Tax=Ramlibacter sp. TaxID=1917967 RepID=UPI002D5F5FE1|nr:BLUF domain-containing protein [Ramlibacter sp.]HZY17869.1 BLUF domain-containing protein [Ramlibacter sp.]